MRDVDCERRRSSINTTSPHFIRSSIKLTIDKAPSRPFSQSSSFVCKDFGLGALFFAGEKRTKLLETWDIRFVHDVL